MRVSQWCDIVLSISTISFYRQSIEDTPITFARKMKMIICSLAGIQNNMKPVIPS